MKTDHSELQANSHFFRLSPSAQRIRQSGRQTTLSGTWVISPKHELATAGTYPLPYIVISRFHGGFAYIKSFKGYIDKQGWEYFSGKRMKDLYDFSH